MRTNAPLALLTISLACPAFASLAPAGFGGELSLLTGYSSKESNFNTDSEIKTGELNSSGSRESDVIVFPLGQLRYTFGPSDNHQLFLGTSRTDVIQGTAAIEVGYKHEVGSRSAVSFSLLPTLMEEDTWADPFVTDEAREETTQSGNAFRVQYTNIRNSGFSADLAYYDRKLDNEMSGEASYTSYADQLSREGDGIYAKLSKNHRLGRGSFIQPSVRINTFSAEGKAMSNTRYGAGLTYIQKTPNHTLALSTNYTYTDFEQANPVFGKTQTNSELGVTAAYEYSDLPGWENWALNLLLSYSYTDSNIAFYKEESLFSAAGISYKF